MATRYDNTPTDEILREVARRLRAERGQLDAIVEQTRDRLVAQARATGAGQAALARLRTLGQPVRAPALRGGTAREIRGARPEAPLPIAPQSQRPVTIRTKKGRVRALAPMAARRDDLARLQQVVATNEARSFAAIRHNSDAIDRLARSIRELALIVAELQERGGPALMQGLLDSFDGLDLRLRRQAREQSSLGTRMQVQSRAAQIQKLNMTASMMQSAAFGTQGDPLAPNNLRVAGNSLVWSVLGDVLDGLGLTNPLETSALAWLSPVASVALARATIQAEAQPVVEPPKPEPPRFLTGIAEDFEAFNFELGGGEFPQQIPSARSTVSLLERLPIEAREPVRQRKNLAVTTSALSIFQGQTLAEIDEGTLTITIVGVADLLESAEALVKAKALRVAWLVDVGASNGG